MTADRDESEDCHGSTDTMDLPVGEKTVIAFPHEHHWALTQEFLAVFGGASHVTLVDMTPGSGAKLLGVLLSNGRGIGVARTSAHVKWIMENLISWVRQKRLVSITSLPKPESLLAWEKQNKPAAVAAVPKALQSPVPKAVETSPATGGGTPVTTPVPKQPAGASTPVKPTGLLEAFGKVAQ